MHTYNHNVHYYETDKMGITHHSNYIKWMEESRISHLNSIGLSLKSIEEMGYVSPVINLTVEYVSSTTFDDEILIETRLSKYNGISLEVSYIMKSGDRIVLKAKSKHCFLRDNKICSLRRDNPKMDKILELELNKDWGKI